MKEKMVHSEASIEETLRTFTKLGIVRTLPMQLPNTETRGRPQVRKTPLHMGTSTRAQQHARVVDARRIPLTLAPRVKIKLSSLGRSILAKKVITEFCCRFTPGGKLIYVAGGESRRGYFDEDRLRTLSVVIQQRGEMPDVVVHFAKTNWIVLIQLATSQGPMNEKRLTQLSSLFRDSKRKLVFVSAFLNRKGFSKCWRKIAWGTHLWIADAPDHMIHFGGQRFLEPYSTPAG